VKSFKINDKLTLVQHELAFKEPPKKVEQKTHHIAVIDCSGSMTWDLPKVRDQLKKKLPKLLKDSDTVSIIWFSGKGEFGTLLEAEAVSSLTDLKNVNSAIDRWLKPVGLTGFKEPMEEVSALVDRIQKKDSDGVFSLMFMSDGQDNQWPKDQIIKAVESSSGKLASATFIEYGYYADRPTLTKMAEAAGGALVFAEDFDKFDPVFDAVIQKKISGKPKIEVKLDFKPIRDFAFALSDGELISYGVDGSSVKIPEDSSAVWYVAESVTGSESIDVQSNDPSVSALYAAISLYSVRMAPDIVLPLLKTSGDVTFIDAFGGCFGKQKYSEFMDMTKAAAFDKSKRLVEGYDPNKVPADDAFTVLDVLNALADDEGNKLLLDSPEFKYTKIGRGRVDADESLTADEQKQIEDLTNQMTATKDPKKVAELAAQIASITASKKPALKFVSQPSPDGYSISNLTYNEDRPNISVLVRKEGTVDVSDRLPTSLEGKIPKQFPTSIYRNYAILKDGLVNVSLLPVKLTPRTVTKLANAVSTGKAPKEAFEFNPNGASKIHLNKLPVINRQMVKSISARTFFETQWELLKSQAEKKVFDSFSKELSPEKKSEGFVALYGDEGAAWLKENGFTDFGFNPKSVVAESTDFYMGKELKASIKGYSTIPSLKDLRGQMAKGKLNGPGSLMKPFFDEAEKISTGTAPLEERIAILNERGRQAKSRSNGFIRKIAADTFTIVVGQVWPSEWASIDDNTIQLNLDGNSVECKLESKEVQVKI
jgi:hypothetical protein